MVFTSAGSILLALLIEWNIRPDLTESGTQGWILILYNWQLWSPNTHSAEPFQVQLEAKAGDGRKVVYFPISCVSIMMTAKGG